VCYTALVTKKQHAVVDSATRFSVRAQEELRLAIASMDGREVFAIGTLDESGIVASLEIIARGNKEAVAAPFRYRENAQVLIHNHPSGTLLPSDADVLVSAEAASEGIGSYIIDNEVSQVMIVAEPVKPKVIKPLEADEIAAVLDKGGKLSKVMPEFEPRASQVEMAHDVADLFSKGGILVAEAGTGVGKSFAYLIPSLAWAIGNRERVVISTATINLQQQIYNKDFPIVNSLFKKPAKAAVIKGRANYLCKRRLYEAIEEDALFSGTSLKLRKILEWDNNGGSGDKSDLDLSEDDPLWSRVCSESDYCLSARCAYHDKCHIVRVRMEAASAQIIIANHHVLLADLEAKRSREGISNTILPSYQALVLDEAHALEASATSLFSEMFSKRTVQRLLYRLFRKKKRSQIGILPAIQKRSGIDAQYINRASAQIEQVASAFDALNTVGLSYCIEKDASILVRSLDEATRAVFSLSLHNAAREVASLIALLGELREMLPSEMEDDENVTELMLTIRALEEIAALVPRFKTPDAEPETIFWLHVDKKNPKEPTLIGTATPLEVAPLLSERLFRKIRSCVCTSATLSIDGSFRWWRARVGVPENAPNGERHYPSPFPYSEHAMLAIDTSAPLPESPLYQDYLKDAVAQLLHASQGRALVLFTSYKTLHDTYAAVGPLLEKEGILVLKQGQKDRYSLLRTFVNDISSVLFATQSFWEGVDAPGETLSLVVIAKLPFRVPTDPIQSSRAAAIDARGGNSFAEMSIPEAVILFKQGFGRLIRHSNDRGIVAVLDARITKKSYGKLFVSSLPRCKIETGDIRHICRSVFEFLEEERGTKEGSQQWIKSRS